MREDAVGVSADAAEFAVDPSPIDAHISEVLSWYAVNAMRRPSGDQLGSESDAGL